MKRIIIIILFLLVIISIYKTTNQMSIIPDTSIRLRVIPNSNEPIDISIKEKVKTYLEDNLYSLTKDINDINEARTIITNSIPEVKENIDNIFNENNYVKSYDINYGYNYFPQKAYKGNIYNEGYYESLVISIGEAKGDNWWCVLFPNFCILDKNDLKNSKSIIKEITVKYSKK